MSFCKGLLFFQLVCFCFFPLVAESNAKESVESALESALTWNPKTQTRKLDSASAIAVLQQAGFIDKDYQFGADFTKYYLPINPLKFLNNEVVLLGHDVPGSAPGCCPSLGLIVAFRIEKNSAMLESFAKERGCSFENNVDIFELSFGAINSSSGVYGLLNCQN